MNGLFLNNIIADRGSFTLGPIETILSFGEITALVGANGAGKTSLTRVLLGQIPFNNGEITLNNKQINVTEASWRSNVGYVPDDPEELLIECTADEFWKFSIGVQILHFPKEKRAKIRARMIDRAYKLSETLNFQPPAGQPIAEFSLGMRKKTQIIAALAPDPQIIIMDEPRNGLDPIGIEKIHRLLDELKADGKLILVTTHDLSWALSYSQNIFALKSGKMVLSNKTEEISQIGGESYLLEKLI